MIIHSTRLSSMYIATKLSDLAAPLVLGLGAGAGWTWTHPGFLDASMLGGVLCDRCALSAFRASGCYLCSSWALGPMVPPHMGRSTYRQREC